MENINKEFLFEQKRCNSGPGWGLLLQVNSSLSLMVSDERAISQTEGSWGQRQVKRRGPEATSRLKSSAQFLPAQV